MKTYREILESDKLDKAKKILKLLDRDVKSPDKKSVRRARIEYKGDLGMLDLSKSEIDQLVKWQKKEGLKS